jgi:LPS export ABC transporter protein LptC
MAMSPRKIAKAMALAGGVLFCLIVAGAVWLVEHRSASQNLHDVAGLVPGALLHAGNFHWTQVKGNQQQWVLTARDASYAANRNSVSLTDAHLSLVSGGKSVTIRAPHAELSLEKNHIRRAALSGGLAVHYGGFELATDQATFFPDSNQLQAPGRVTVSGEGLTVVGSGLNADTKAQIFELEKQVTTHVVLRSGGGASKGF